MMSKPSSTLFAPQGSSRLVEGKVNAKTLMVTARLVTDKRFVVTLNGGSMAPFLFAGDKALITPSDCHTVGHLYLAYVGNDTLIVHRLVALNDGLAILKGDQTGQFESVPLGEVIGEVSAIKVEGVSEWRDPTRPVVLRILITHISRTIGEYCCSVKRRGAFKSRMHRIRCRVLNWTCCVARRLMPSINYEGPVKLALRCLVWIM
jgi:hypothetical protein